MTFVSCQAGLNIGDVFQDTPLTKSGDSTLFVDTLSLNKADSLQISKWDALKIVEPITSKYPDRWVDISNSIIPANTSIAYNNLGEYLDVDNLSYLLSPDYDSWLLSLGCNQSFLGKQEVLHLFVNVNTGEFKEVYLEGRAIVEWDYSRYTFLQTDKKTDRNNSKDLPPVLRNTNPNKWAVIISGGISKMSNFSCFWYDVYYAYNSIINHLDYPKSCVYCLVSDGNDTTEDRMISNYVFDDSPTDYDGDNLSDVDYPAQKEWISDVFDSISSMALPGDEVLVFMTGHDNMNQGITLWGGETLSPSELNFELNKLDPGVMVDVVMGQSYSGCFLPTLESTNRTITTACNSTETASLNIFLCNYFLYAWASSVDACSISGDSFVSPYEAYTLACTVAPLLFDNYSNHPQFSSTPTSFGSDHSLSGGYIPYISGSDYLSTNVNSVFTITNFPYSATATWSVGDNASIVSYADSTAIIKGYISNSLQYSAPNTSLTASIVISGKTHTISKQIASIWKPGAYIGNNHINGGNGVYSIVTYPGAYGFYWLCTNPDWQIISQNGGYVLVSEGNTVDPVYFSVSFYDPLGETITIVDQVY